MMGDSIGNIHENEILVIGEDLNGYAGWDVMGIDGYRERDVDGENILDICQSRRLKILNTMFKNEDKKKSLIRMGVEGHKLITSW